MYTIYSTTNKVDFNFQGQQKLLPHALMELEKLLGGQLIRHLDPNWAEDEKNPKEINEHWYVFEGKDNIEGKMIGEVTIKIKRHDKGKNN